MGREDIQKKLLKQIDTGNLNICGIIDSNPELDNTYLNGIRVYGRDRMDELDIDYILISSMSYEKEIFDDLKRTVDIGKLITIYNY
jgi:FlaA1/EpsC-like NDP-sugar epimerase